MGMQSVEKVITERILVCDLCGNEIEKTDDSEALVKIADYEKLKEVDRPIATANHTRFTWPTQLMRKKHREEAEEHNKLHEADKSVEYRSIWLTTEEWDMHGECIATLLKTAVTMREKREEEEREAAKNVEAPTAE